jgi:hypothetical protein
MHIVQNRGSQTLTLQLHDSLKWGIHGSCVLYDIVYTLCCFKAHICVPASACLDWAAVGVRWTNHGREGRIIEEWTAYLGRRENKRFYCVREIGEEGETHAETTSAEP